jgi:hypothetical protein
LKRAEVLLNTLIGSICASTSRQIRHAGPLAYLIKDAQADVIPLIVCGAPGLSVLLLELLLLVMIVLLDFPWLLWVEVPQHAIQLVMTADML